MSHVVGRAAVLGVALTVACAPRAPVVTDATYPAFVFPEVPFSLVSADTADAHETAWAYLQVGQLETARIHYERLLDDVPSFYPAEVGLGWVHLAYGEPAKAADRFSKARKVNPSYVSALVGSGEAFLALEQPEESLASFEAALSADGSLTYLRETIEELGFTVIRQRLAVAAAAAEAGRYDEARSAYQRVLEMSPESGFVHLELARMERQRGDPDQALKHTRRAIDLDRLDGLALVLEGEILEDLGDLEGALASYEYADAVDPSDENAERIDRVGESIRLATLPDNFHAIPQKPEVTRGELAALLGVRLVDLFAVSAGQSAIITDTREYWSGEWIQAVVDAGVMSVDAAYRFDPARPVRRSELADVVDVALDLIAAHRGREVDTVALVSPRDMRPSHLSYDAVTRAVASGVLDLLEDDTFQPTLIVTGAEAAVTCERLAALNSNDR